uniref:MYND-type domain-containing protein n=1 Tax=viral metagenome TaxID=1070528 RepID=A0A6C0F051_9ZZZZ
MATSIGPIVSSPKAKPYDYSIYNLASLPQDDFNRIIDINNRGPEFIKFINHYKKISNRFEYDDETDIETNEYITILIDHINSQRQKFNKWSFKFYKKCLKIEKFFKVKKGDRDDDEDDDDVLDTLKCAFCEQYKLRKDLKKCGICKTVRYCSIACQSRDWKLKHKADCSLGCNAAHQDMENDLEIDSEIESEPENVKRNSDINDVD